MKHLKLLTAAVILILLISSIATTSYIIINKQKNVLQEEETQKPFYVGVTYCGSSVQEAKDLIDKVKDYTNLFVLLSGPFIIDKTAINEIGDYACASNLSYAILGSKDLSYWINDWVIEAKERWKEQFIGIYYSDEPGGKMLDGKGEISVQITTENYVRTTIKRTSDGVITFNEYFADDNNNIITIYRTYYLDGRVNVEKSHSYEWIFIHEYYSTSQENQPINGSIVNHYKCITDKFEYYPNGTITIEENTIEEKIRHIRNESNGSVMIRQLPETDVLDINFYTSENITKYPYEILSYEEILKQKPLQTFDDAAETFVNMNKENLEKINKTQLEKESILVFTSDYGFYWWDYKSGYDIMLTQLGWNHTISQDIGLVRGAANMQNKSWGTIITWKYDQPPYLADGNETYNQLKTSYEAGAEYVLIFNYSEDPTDPNTLQEEHYQALEQFWNDVVQNPKIKHGSIKANAVLVLPQNYGWGMRHSQDTIWGIWPADETSQQIWQTLQNKIDKHGLKLDIIYEDPNYPIAGKYSNIYYWDQN